MKEIVKNHSFRNERGEISVNLKSLAEDEKFRSEVVKEIVNKVKKSNHACVLFPSYKPHCSDNPLGKLINEVALSLVVETLVTGDVRKIRDVHSPVNEVIIIKQSFKTGTGLKEQIESLRKMGMSVSVICLIAHSGAALDSFRYANDVSVETLVCLDEIPYLKG